ncbi:BON domain-containing protein [Fimbriiglobus ruber]|uniref:BON domain-containing protein n=1 Tax=Fimbriiglobus ruber TaxID=1908690 RepID=A0A225DSV0_9BACT|nr:BON domain-containing protein [Fimbriiglobus ruber]OWK39177.1 hypothetical protein FRUB_06259 [Fimbriiglobus ruber]
MNVSAVLDMPTPEATLSASAMPELRRLIVEATDHEVILSGRVSSYYHKQMAQEAVRHVAGRRRIVNRVAVHR